MKKKNKKIRFWALKIFIITLILTAGISVAVGAVMGSLSIIWAAIIILVIVAIGVVFDLIGIAFATCDPKPFVSMAAKKIKRAKSALRLIKNADVVSNICGDVVGDICGIVSGAAGASIAIKVAISSPGTPELVWAIVMSSVIASLTVAGKAAGKTIAIKNSKRIVSFVAYALSAFFRDERNGGSNGR